MFTWIKGHPWEFLGAWYIISTAVSTMPTPMPSQRLYDWFYKFMHVLVGNAAKAFPQLRLSALDRTSLPYTDKLEQVAAKAAEKGTQQDVAEKSGPNGS